MSRFYTLLLLIFSFFSAQAQWDRMEVPIKTGPNNLAFGTAGGLNCPQVMHANLNLDAQIDLVIFDRVGNVWLPFLADCSGEACEWVFAPEYVAYFPVIKNWALLRDFNNDGYEDIFAFSDIPGIAGVQVYTGKAEGGHLAFDKMYFANNNFGLLYFPIGAISTNLYVSDQDYPAVDDIDGDGDLDIITFESAGGTLDYYRNQSVQLGFGTDSLRFNLVDQCWGGFYEPGLTEAVNLSGSIDTCASFLMSGGIEARHAGSTVLTYDLDNDNDKEVILGDISFNNLNMLTNGGDSETAFMTAQDNDFPSNSVPVDIPVFPASFLVDLNFDNNLDLIASPNARFTAENRKVMWYYPNEGSNEVPEFVFQSKGFIVDQMVDMGAYSHPAFADVDADGLTDLVVGNGFFFQLGGLKDARLWYFRNTGTATTPEYTLLDTDFGSLNSFSNLTFSFSPTFGDLDSDNDLDMLVGDEYGELFYVENTAGANQPMAFATPVPGFQSIDVGTNAIPQIIDLNGDGLKDLVIGERNGNVNYLKNLGTPTTPQFNPNNVDPAPITNSFLGLIDVRVGTQSTGSSAPCIWPTSGQPRLLIGSESGQLFQFTDIVGNIDSAEAFTLVNNNVAQMRQGASLHPALADIDNDGLLEMVVGNMRGGLTFFQTELTVEGNNSVGELNPANIKLWPNPAQNAFTLSLNMSGTFEYSIFATDGRLVQHDQAEGPDALIEIENLSKGLYFIRIEWPNGQRVSRPLLKQ